jgi:hypothetical protein
VEDHEPAQFQRSQAAALSLEEPLHIWNGKNSPSPNLDMEVQHSFGGGREKFLEGASNAMRTVWSKK